VNCHARTWPIAIVPERDRRSHAARRTTSSPPSRTREGPVARITPLFRSTACKPLTSGRVNLRLRFLLMDFCALRLLPLLVRLGGRGMPVRQRSAKPSSRVRFPPSPLGTQRFTSDSRSRWTPVRGASPSGAKNCARPHSAWTFHHAPAPERVVNELMAAIDVESIRPSSRSHQAVGQRAHFRRAQLR
jgi:hypothetical protein